MPDYGGAASGALTGAATGFGIGGPIGGGIGGLIGGLGGLFGNKKKKKKISSLDKRQQELNRQQHESILGQGPLADLYNYDPEQANQVFDKTIGRKAQRSFSEETVPTITGAFRSNGLQTSSYAGDAVAKAGRDVQESLDAQRAQYLYGEQKDARNAKRSAVENLQNRNTFAYDKNNQGGFNLDNILGSLSPEIVDQLKNYFKRGK